MERVRNIMLYIEENLKPQSNLQSYQLDDLYEGNDDYQVFVEHIDILIKIKLQNNCYI